MSIDSPGDVTHDGPGVGTSSDAPLPSDVQPFPVSCACLNVVVEAYGADTLVERLGDGKTEPPFGERVKVWMPADAENIRHMPMSTFDKDGDEAWRKCWVCDTRVYVVTGDAAKGNIAPINTWVEVNLTNGVLYGDQVDAARQRTPLVWSGLLLDIPLTSTFGRPPTSTAPVPYPPEKSSSAVLLPPIPDPFFLPPPFIPSHPALREMCKAAVVALQARHDDIERDIRQYIAQRTADMRRLEDQVRAEVETMWDRYVQGPLGGQDFDRRGSISMPTSRVASGAAPPPPKESRGSHDSQDSKRDSKDSKEPSIEKVDLQFERARSKDSLPSGVEPSPPNISGQFNAHTATAAASLLSASIVNNTFHAPPRRAARELDDEIEAIAQTATRDNGMSREVAMSYAFSAMNEHAGRRGPAAEAKEEKQELHEAQGVEEEAEEREKGIDSWAAMERASAAKAVSKEVNSVELAEQAEGVKDVAKDKKAKDKARAHVKFQEPTKEEKGKDRAKHKEEKADGEGVDEEKADASGDDDEDEDYVFDMDTDEVGQSKTSIEQPEVKAPPRNKVETMVENNLSRTFAAEAPSHRAAWRAVEEHGLKNVLRRSTPHDDDDDDEEYTPADIGLARSMPVNIVLPPRPGREMQIKTSLTDRKGMMVPNLINVMPERGKHSSPRAIAGSVARGTGGRRGSRSISGEREREQVMSYAADPGVVFETLAEDAVDSDSDEDAPAQVNGTSKFVPPHVLAKRASEKGKGESGWRSVAQ